MIQNFCFFVYLGAACSGFRMAKTSNEAEGLCRAIENGMTDEKIQQIMCEKPHELDVESWEIPDTVSVDTNCLQSN